MKIIGFVRLPRWAAALGSANRPAGLRTPTCPWLRRAMLIVWCSR
jgi:hypothetical protein